MSQLRSILRFAPILGLAALPFLASCGGAMSPDRRQDTRPDPLADLDAQEARLRAAQQELEQAGPACETRCHAGSSICDAARRICVIAGELGDARSQTRCASAQSACTEAGTQLSACHCEEDAPDAGRVKSLDCGL
jgi:hypothetical protein